MEKKETLNYIFEQVRAAGLAKTQKDFAELLGINRNGLSAALNGDEKYLTDSLVNKAIRFFEENIKKNEDGSIYPKASLPVIPTEAMAGTLSEFASSIRNYDCERMVSPIKGAEMAIKVCGDSMSPDIPNGSVILIKRVWEDQFVEWGKVFCLDTQNGAIIKKVYPTEDQEVVECRSVNPAYPPFRVNVKHINRWFRVLMILSQQ